MDIKERFWSKTRVNKEHEWGGTPCVDWTASKVGKGYGQFRLNGAMTRAHRVAFELTNGEIPDGLHVLHRCDRPECVNPEHLFLGTHADNMADKIKKGRGPKGEASHLSTTTEEKVRLIKRFIERHPPEPRSKGGQLLFLSRWLDVSIHSIRMISCGKRWRHVK